MGKKVCYPHFYSLNQSSPCLLIIVTYRDRAVSSSSPIRLQTFHPIIAAWALCQFDRAPARVKEWINQLNGLSATKPHLTPDLTTLSAQIIAWKNVQAGIIAKANQTKRSSSSSSSSDGQLNGTSMESSQLNNGSKVSRDAEMAFVAAQNCMEHLRTIMPEIKPASVHDNLALISMSCDTIQTWGCASRYALQHPTLSGSLDASHGVHEMLKVARWYDSKIEKDGASADGGINDDNNLQGYFNFHLIGEIYSEIISQLHQLDSALDSCTTTEVDSTSTHFSREIANVERMLNDFDVCSRNISSQMYMTADSKALRHKLYKEILTGCAGGLTSPADHGHAIRLCKLIMGQLLWQHEKFNLDIGDGRGPSSFHSPRPDDVTEIFASIASLTGTVVPIPQERTYVLTVLWQNAKPFFERRQQKFESSKYYHSVMVVDKARLIGAMRMAMGDSELTEPFIRSFDEQRRQPRRKARGNTWLSFVEDLLRK